ncbi:MAG TPA: hypothetical protein VK480_04215, partial [Solirubrobacterales bacterium]|nr:hypothetical protein [Solirubrobacterales bacterium]
RLLAGSLDRAVDIAATLELRGYSLVGTSDAPARAWRRGVRFRNRRTRSRYDRRFYATAALVLAVAIAGKLLGADEFHTYPTIDLSLSPATLTVAALIALSGLAPHGPQSRLLSADGPKSPTRSGKSARRRGGWDGSARRQGVARV